MRDPPLDSRRHEDSEADAKKHSFPGKLRPCRGPPPLPALRPPGPWAPPPRRTRFWVQRRMRKVSILCSLR